MGGQGGTGRGGATCSLLGSHALQQAVQASLPMPADQAMPTAPQQRACLQDQPEPDRAGGHRGRDQCF